MKKFQSRKHTLKVGRRGFIAVEVVQKGQEHPPGFENYHQFRQIVRVEFGGGNLGRALSVKVGKILQLHVYFSDDSRVQLIFHDTETCRAFYDELVSKIERLP